MPWLNQGNIEMPSVFITRQLMQIPCMLLHTACGDGLITKFATIHRRYKDNNRALDLKPNFSSALTNRSTTLWGMRQYDKALVDVNRAIELTPDYARAYRVRSLIYLDMRNNANAIEDSNKAIELNPNAPTAYLYRGHAYRNIGRYEEALKDYQKSIEINPIDPDVYNGRGYAYILLKKYDDALRDFNKALELNQNPETALHSPVIALYRRGLVYNQLRDYKGAIRDFSKVIEIDKDNAAAYYHRSLSYKQIGKADESANDLKKAAQLGNVQAQKAIKNRDTNPMRVITSGETRQLHTVQFGIVRSVAAEDNRPRQHVRGQPLGYSRDRLLASIRLWVAVHTGRDARESDRLEPGLRRQPERLPIAGSQKLRLTRLPILIDRSDGMDDVSGRKGVPPVMRASPVGHPPSRRHSASNPGPAAR